MSNTFTVGQKVHLQPPPHAMVGYYKKKWEMGKTLEVVAVTPNPQSVTAATYTVRLRIRLKR